MMVDQLPELSFVHPLPGFPGLKRYALVRLDDRANAADGADGATMDGGSANGSANGAAKVPLQASDYEMKGGVASAASASGGTATATATLDPATRTEEDKALAEAIAEAVLYELRSVERPDTRFLVGVPKAFFPDYEVELDDRSAHELGITEPADAVVLVILSAGADPASTTANLLAPIVINTFTRSAGQVILSGSNYPVRAVISDE